MTSQLVALRRGKTGGVQRHSLARPLDASKNGKLQEILKEEVNSCPRGQLLNDTAVCFQFACGWKDAVGFLTRPVIEESDDGEEDAHALGSFTVHCPLLTVSFSLKRHEILEHGLLSSLLVTG